MTREDSIDGYWDIRVMTREELQRIQARLLAAAQPGAYKSGGIECIVRGVLMTSVPYYKPEDWVIHVNRDGDTLSVHVQHAPQISHVNVNVSCFAGEGKPVSA